MKYKELVRLEIRFYQGIFGGLFFILMAVICYVCKKKFYIKRTFLSLFDTKTRFICDNCYKNNPINPKVNIVPLDDGEIMIISLLDTIYKVDMRPYVYEINQVYQYFMDLYNDYHIILLDYLSLTYFNLEVLSFIKTAFDKKVLIICGVLKK